MQQQAESMMNDASRARIGGLNRKILPRGVVQYRSNNTHTHKKKPALRPAVCSQPALFTTRDSLWKNKYSSLILHLILSSDVNNSFFLSFFRYSRILFIYVRVDSVFCSDSCCLHHLFCLNHPLYNEDNNNNKKRTRHGWYDASSQEKSDYFFHFFFQMALSSVRC